MMIPRLECLSVEGSGDLWALSYDKQDYDQEGRRREKVTIATIRSL